MASAKTAGSDTTVRNRMKDNQASHDAAIDWHIARASQCRVLVAGAADAVEHSLAVLMPHLGPPVCCWTPDTSLPSPRDVKTLVIRNVDALSAIRQRELLLWLEQAAVAQTRVISTTTVPLFQHVTAGLFLDALYYRLNTVMLSGADTWVTDDVDCRPRLAEEDLQREMSS
jgi:sigma-54-interacting transcriptional regulator